MKYVRCFSPEIYKLDLDNNMRLENSFSPAIFEDIPHNL